jgi:hypothetical protein
MGRRLPAACALALIALPAFASVDVSVDSITSPRQYVRAHDTIYPLAVVSNRGTDSTGFTAWMTLINPYGSVTYTESAARALPAGQSVVVAFPRVILVSEGRWTARCSADAAGDTSLPNDVYAKPFTVSSEPSHYPTGWREVIPVPSGPSGKPASAGAWLSFMAATQRTYVAKGNRSADFYEYDRNPWYPFEDRFEMLAPVPLGPRGKLPRAGCRGACDGNRYVYMVKGGGTGEFYRYDAVTDSWEQLPDVPRSALGRTVRDGSDLVYAEVAGRSYLYLLKGGGFEFWRFGVASGCWEALPPAPTGAGKKWRAGSWLVWDRSHAIYAHKGRCPELYRYDIRAGTWDPDPLAPMPKAGTCGTHKAGRGSAATWHDGTIYALKGSNTTEIWSYAPLADSWREFDTIPMGRASGGNRGVNKGADIASYETGYVPAVLLVLKGGWTSQFWAYEPEWGAREHPAPEANAQGRTGRVTGPAPTGNITGTLLAGAGPGRAVAGAAELLDVNGRRVMTLSPGNAPTGPPPGVYFVRERSAVRKLIIVR